MSSKTTPALTRKHSSSVTPTSSPHPLGGKQTGSSNNLRQRSNTTLIPSSSQKFFGQQPRQQQQNNHQNNNNNTNSDPDSDDGDDEEDEETSDNLHSSQPLDDDGEKKVKELTAEEKSFLEYIAQADHDMGEQIAVEVRMRQVVLVDIVEHSIAVASQHEFSRQAVSEVADDICDTLENFVEFLMCPSFDDGRIREEGWFDHQCTTVPKYDEFAKHQQQDIINDYQNNALHMDPNERDNNFMTMMMIMIPTTIKNDNGDDVIAVTRSRKEQEKLRKAQLGVDASASPTALLMIDGNKNMKNNTKIPTISTQGRKNATPTPSNNNNNTFKTTSTRDTPPPAPFAPPTTTFLVVSSQQQNQLSKSQEVSTRRTSSVATSSKSIAANKAKKQQRKPILLNDSDEGVSWSNSNQQQQNHQNKSQHEDDDEAYGDDNADEPDDLYIEYFDEATDGIFQGLHSEAWCRGVMDTNVVPPRPKISHEDRKLLTQREAQRNIVKFLKKKRQQEAAALLEEEKTKELTEEARQAKLHAIEMATATAAERAASTMDHWSTNATAGGRYLLGFNRGQQRRTQLDDLFGTGNSSSSDDEDDGEACDENGGTKPKAKKTQSKSKAKTALKIELTPVVKKNEELNEANNNDNTAASVSSNASSDDDDNEKSSDSDFTSSGEDGDETKKKRKRSKSSSLTFMTKNLLYYRVVSDVKLQKRLNRRFEKGLDPVKLISDRCEQIMNREESKEDPYIAESKIKEFKSCLQKLLLREMDSNLKRLGWNGNLENNNDDDDDDVNLDLENRVAASHGNKNRQVRLLLHDDAEIPQNNNAPPSPSTALRTIGKRNAISATSSVTTPQLGAAAAKNKQQQQNTATTTTTPPKTASSFFASSSKDFNDATPLNLRIVSKNQEVQQQRMERHATALLHNSKEALTSAEERRQAALREKSSQVISRRRGVHNQEQNQLQQLLDSNAHNNDAMSLLQQQQQHHQQQHGTNKNNSLEHDKVLELIELSEKRKPLLLEEEEDFLGAALQQNKNNAEGAFFYAGNASPNRYQSNNSNNNYAQTGAVTSATGGMILERVPILRRVRFPKKFAKFSDDKLLKMLRVLLFPENHTIEAERKKREIRQQLDAQKMKSDNADDIGENKMASSNSLIGDNKNKSEEQLAFEATWKGVDFKKQERDAEERKLLQERRQKAREEQKQHDSNPHPKSIAVTSSSTQQHHQQKQQSQQTVIIDSRLGCAIKVKRDLINEAGFDDTNSSKNNSANINNHNINTAIDGNNNSANVKRNSTTTLSTPSPTTATNASINKKFMTRAQLEQLEKEDSVKNHNINARPSVKFLASSNDQTPLKRRSSRNNDGNSEQQAILSLRSILAASTPEPKRSTSVNLLPPPPHPSTPAAKVVSTSSSAHKSLNREAVIAATSSNNNNNNNTSVNQDASGQFAYKGKVLLSNAQKKRIQEAKQLAYETMFVDRPTHGPMIEKNKLSSSSGVTLKLISDE